MNQPEIRKAISVFVPLSDWRVIRDEAIRRRIPMTELCRRWVEPQLDRLRRANEPSVDGPAATECAYCRASLTDRTGRRRYCSAACSSAASRERRHQRAAFYRRRESYRE